MSAADRSQRQRRADMEGRAERIEAAKRDLMADLDYYTDPENQKEEP